MNSINITLSTDQRYSMMTCMCINDIILNKKNKTALNFYVLINDVSNEMKNILMMFNKKENVTLSLIDITERCKEFEEEYNKINSKANFSGHVSGTAFMRCFLPELLNDIDKVIYLDQDIYVNGDLGKFFNIDIKDFLLAAPIDTFSILIGERNPSYQCCKEMFDERKYIQDGQMLLNLKKMRAFDFSNKCKDCLKQILPPNKDMDVINIVGKGQIKTLSHLFCVPRAAIELARNGYASNAFLDIRYYDLFSKTGCDSVDKLLKESIIWHFYGNKEHDLKACPSLQKMFMDAKYRLEKTLQELQK